MDKSIYDKIIVKMEFGELKKKLEKQLEQQQKDKPKKLDNMQGVIKSFKN